MLSSPISVSVFCDHPAEGWYSMTRYAQGLAYGFARLEMTDLSLQFLTPPNPWPVPRGMFWRRLTFPLWCRQHQGMVNHVLDHSYGHLVYGLDASRTVVTVHDISPLLFPGKKLGLSQMMWRWAWRGAVQAGYYITDSCFVRQTLVERFGFVAERVKVVPLGVEAGFRPFSADVVAALRAKYQLPPLPVLLHVGGVQKRKNFEGLIEAVANLHREGITAVLIHAGRPPTPRQQTQIEANGLSQFVHCLGYVTDEELVNLYNLADVFVFPSLYEGFGIPPLEAMACGTPVITSNAASLPEVVGDAGILVDATDVEALTDAIRRVLEDSTLAATLRAKGLARARQFTWERTAQETAAVYRAIWEAMA